MAVTQQYNAQTEPAYLKAAGDEPLPGYVLLAPLGRGGYGEVWKCEAPGGLLKAIKFVAGSDDGQRRDESLLRQEYEAFQQVKAIRHPFLLCLERVELVDGELVMVMGLADKHIGDRFNECLVQGQTGIPRDELLGYLREAAEALDVIGTQHGLQHLDVKPANLFLTAGHLQVGDYGLVSKLDGGSEGGRNRGLTPKYAAPEVLLGKVHTHSDQYSLALVYFELLTGAFPFAGRSAQQMMLQHMSAPPNLSALPEWERRPVGMALAKLPDERHPSCRDFVDAVARARPPAARLSPVATPAPRATSPAGSGLRPQPPLSTPPTPRPFASDATMKATGTSHFGGLPALVGVSKFVPPQEEVRPPEDDCVPLTAALAGVVLPELRPVYSVEQLLGQPAADPQVSAVQVAQAVLAAAGYDPAVHLAADDIARDAAGAWVSRFPSQIDPRIGLRKLALICEQFRVTAEPVDDRRLTFRHLAPAAGIFGFGKKPPAGFEVTVEFPDAGAEKADTIVTGRLFGKPPADFIHAAEKGIVRMIEAIRSLLHCVPERRRHPRVPAEFPLQLFPLHSDSRVDVAVPGRTVNVSVSGLALCAVGFPACKYFYVAFDGIRGIEGVALLAETVRRKQQPDTFLLTCRYRHEQ
jgi:eukaryotic-like serine/threonine-protein kinase